MKRPPGGPPGGGLGPGVSAGKGGPPQEKAIPRKYTVGLSLMGRNIFNNNVNAGQPVGVLSSPLFGRSNSLAGGFFSSSSANRSVDMQMNFSF